MPEQFSPVRLFITLLVIIFVTEAALMVLLPILVPYHIDPLVEAIIDAAALTIIASAFLWRLFAQPLRLALLSKTAQAAAIMNAAAEGIITIDERGIIQFFNRAAENMFGYTAREVIGANVSMLMPEPHVREHDTHLANYLRTGQAKVIGKVREMTALRKDGTAFPIELKVTELKLGGERSFTGMIHDITERKLAEDVVRKSEARLALALEGSNLALFDWDVRTGTVQLSKEWSVFLGNTPQATTTNIRDLARLVHPDDAARFQDELRAALTGEKRYYEVEHRVKNLRGKWAWVLSRTKVVERDALGRALRVTGVYADITPRKQIEQMKDEFISTVNHELRTPLTVIVGSLALLKEGLAGLPPDQAMMLDMACQNSARLQSLVNDILDLEKIASGTMRFDRAPVALGPFLRRALEINRLYADRFKVRYELRGPLPQISLTADPERLMQAITNLLSNAAKFSPKGGAIIIAATIAGDRARVTVTDHGTGVPVEFRDRIFGKFAQADASNTRGQGGSGLGLSICKAIIENMGGRIGFESVPGQGATFYFELPYTEDFGSLSDLS